MELKQEWLETILSKHARENTVAKVLNVDTESVVAKGDNYVSDMIRIKMDVILGSGKKTVRSVVVKLVPETEMRSKHIKQWGVFKKEIQMYNHILPSMSDLLLEVGEGNEIMWPRCIDYRPFDRLVFEDLKELGYKMAPKKKGLDLAHASIVLKSLAKFHAMSVILKERGILVPDDFAESIFSFDRQLVQTYHDGAFSIMAEVIEKTWGPEWQEWPEKLREWTGKSVDILLEIFKKDDKAFNVLNHGDCWSNNMLFKYVPDTDIPASLRFVDFQLSYYNNYGMDLQYLISSSVQPSVKETSIDEILKTYHQALVLNLNKFGYAQDNVPTFDEVRDAYDKASFFGVVVGLTTMPFMLSEPDDVPDLEELFKEMETGESKPNMALFLGKEFTRRIQYTMKNLKL